MLTVITASIISIAAYFVVYAQSPNDTSTIDNMTNITTTTRNMTNSTGMENMTSLGNTTSMKADGGDDLSVRIVKESDMIKKLIPSENSNESNSFDTKMYKIGK